jgi:hypothetical protein
MQLGLYIQSLLDKLCLKLNLQPCKITCEIMPTIEIGSPKIAALQAKEFEFSVLDWINDPDALPSLCATDGVIASMLGSTNYPDTEHQQTKSERS